LIFCVGSFGLTIPAPGIEDILDVGLNLRARAYRPWDRKIADPIVGRTRWRSPARLFDAFASSALLIGTKRRWSCSVLGPLVFAQAPRAPPRGRAPTRGTAATVARVRRSWRRPRRRPRNKDCAAQFGPRQAPILPAQAALVSPAPGALLRRGAFCCRLCVDAGTEPRNEAGPNLLTHFTPK
jgi:hypothetical protein